MRVFLGPFLSLGAKSRFLGNRDRAGAETGSKSRLRRVETKNAVLARPLGGQFAEFWVIPIPRGSRPSIAALTRSGARKAREIVMLTFRTLQPSRPAMLSVFVDP